MLILLVFLPFRQCKFTRLFRSFVVWCSWQWTAKDESVRECGLRKRMSLVLGFWWYGSLCMSGRISGERARMKTENGTR
jgi:ribosomal protein L34